MSNVTDFPKQPELEWIVGPFKQYRVVIEGKLIPNLEATKGETHTWLVLDGRFGIEVPNDLAYQVADFAATAMAIGQGYSHIGAESKSSPFAPTMTKLDSLPKATP